MLNFRYIKLLIDEGYNDGNDGLLTVQEIKIFSSGINIIENAGIIATASSSFSSSASNAIDGIITNYASCWATGSNTGTYELNGSQWLKLDFVTNKLIEINNIILTTYKGYGYAQLKNYRIAISLDDINYTTIATVTNKQPINGNREDNLYCLFNRKTNVEDMEIGDSIPCRYTAVTNTVGNFSELGICTADEIPLAGTATPDGLFNWIMAGYDVLGRKKLIADRNIQTGISYDVLNNAGYISGNNLLLNGSTVSPNMTSNSTPSPYVVSADSEYVDGSKAYQAFSSIDRWWTYAVPPVEGHWWKIDYGFGNETIINQFSVSSVSEGSNNSLKSFAFYGSNDDLSYTLLTQGTNPDDLIIRNWSFTNETKYRYYKFIFPGGSYSNIVYAGFKNLKFRYIKTDINNKLYTRLLTGGINSTDTNNEWDKIIVNSNLNNNIIAGDNNIWNWSGIYSFTSTSVSGNPSYKTIRGNTSVSTNAISATSSQYAYRPMLLVESLFTNTSPVVKNLSSTITNNGFSIQVTGDSVSDIDLTNLVKYQVSIKKPDNSIVVKRAYDSSFTTNDLNFSTLNFNISDFGIGINNILIDTTDDQVPPATYQHVIIVTRGSVLKSILQDGFKWKYIDGDNLLVALNSYSGSTNAVKETALLTHGMGTNLVMNASLNSQIENPSSFKIVIGKFDLLK